MVPRQHFFKRYFAIGEEFRVNAATIKRFLPAFKMKMFIPRIKFTPVSERLQHYIAQFARTFGKHRFNQRIGAVVIESAFEHPTLIDVKNGVIDEWDAFNDDNEWVLSEDMIGQIKDIIYKRDLLTTVRETNEIPSTVKFNG